MDNDPHPIDEGASQQPQIESNEVNPEALARLARRRALVRGLGAGSAALAAASPIKSLAVTNSLTGAGGRVCSISGTQSGAHSKTTITAICGGRGPTYYNTVDKWPGYTISTPNCSYSNGTTLYTKDAKFNQLFGSGSSTNSAFVIVSTTPTSDEAHWIVALLNANSTKAGYVAPYSAAEVKALYTDTTKRAAALAFFKGYMETLTT